MNTYIILLLIMIIILLCYIIYQQRKILKRTSLPLETKVLEKEEEDDSMRQAGSYGEDVFAKWLSKKMTVYDVLVRNVSITYDNKTTEIDNVLINDHGVFIFEVKNYNGVLRGEVDDQLWTKIHYTKDGTTVLKKTNNPIRQVRRQIYLLSHYLESCGIKIYVHGYVYFINCNSPVQNKHVLDNMNDVAYTIHCDEIHNHLTTDQILEIKSILERNIQE